jgi:hypothetical protein
VNKERALKRALRGKDFLTQLASFFSLSDRRQLPLTEYHKEQISQGQVDTVACKRERAREKNSVIQKGKVLRHFCVCSFHSH